MKALIILALLGLSACAPEPSKSDPLNKHHNFVLVSSTCGQSGVGLSTNGHSELGDGIPLDVEIGQEVTGFPSCYRGGSAILIFGTDAGGPNFTTTMFNKHGASAMCGNAGLEFQWETTYNYTIVGRTLTLTSPTCTNVFKELPIM